jgi:hypothetical protein
MSFRWVCQCGLTGGCELCIDAYYGSMIPPPPRMVVHCKLDVFDVYIGRPSKWGNPFSHRPGGLAEFRVATREEAVARYKEWIVTQPELMSALPSLQNKVLGCWCSPRACHGDVLIELLKERGDVLWET